MSKLLLSMVGTIWKIYQISVVLPASIVASIVLVTVALDSSSLSDHLNDFVVFVDAKIRPAPEGHFLVSRCQDSDTRYLLQPISSAGSDCKTLSLEPVSLARLFRFLVSRATSAYLFLIFASVAIYVFLLQPLRRSST